MSKALTAFKKQDQFATTLLAAMLDAFREGDGEHAIDPILGPEEQRWAPETIAMEIQQEVGKTIPDNFNRAMAAIELLTTNNFFHSVSDFVRLCNLLAFSDAPDGFDPADCHEIGWAVTEAALLLNGMWEPFSEEIVGYVEAMLKQEGFTSLPASIQTAFGDQLQFNPNFAFTDDTSMIAIGQGIAEENTASVDALVSETMDRLQRQVAETPFKKPVSPDWLTRMLSAA